MGVFLFIVDLSPITLSGLRAELIPLAREHFPALYDAGQSDQIWTYMTLQSQPAQEEFERYLEGALADQIAGTCLPFAIMDRNTHQLVGSTRLFDISPKNRNGEIGHTWLNPSVWRTRINTECKYLLLRHAFETMGMIRVQLKTDLRNSRSQAAIERLGAVREGVLRNHVILPDGTIRHSVMYSITDAEWPDVKTRLERYLAK